MTIKTNNIFLFRNNKIDKDLTHLYFCIVTNLDYVIITFNNLPAFITVSW